MKLARTIGSGSWLLGLQAETLVKSEAPGRCFPGMMQGVGREFHMLPWPVATMAQVPQPLWGYSREPGDLPLTASSLHSFIEDNEIGSISKNALRGLRSLTHLCVFPLPQPTLGGTPHPSPWHHPRSC